MEFMYTSARNFIEGNGIVSSVLYLHVLCTSPTTTSGGNTCRWPHCAYHLNVYSAYRYM